VALVFSPTGVVEVPRVLGYRLAERLIWVMSSRLAARAAWSSWSGGAMVGGEQVGLERCPADCWAAAGVVGWLGGVGVELLD
jgi:hypothetical protein